MLGAIEEGKVSAHLLRDKQLVERIKALKLQRGDTRLQTLMAQLPPADTGLDKLLATRRAAYLTKPGKATKGKSVFITYCSSCHKLGGRGGDVAPSLDGIGNRGIDRLLEDLLDPDRNVDPGFAMTVVTTKDGTVIAGIGARDKGKHLEVTDAKGKSLAIPKRDISSQKKSSLSLMSAALTRAISEREFVDLMRFLLQQK